MDTSHRRSRVFISFAHEDVGDAARVASRLRRDNIDVWEFTARAESGNWYRNELRALRDSKLAIFLLTPNSAASSACVDEAERVADPTQKETVALPVVLGEWDYSGSDLWLLLGKWNGVIAPRGLDEAALDRVAGLVHDRLGSRAVSSLSTGQALVAVKDDLRDYLAQQPALDEPALREKASALQLKHRGRMVSFVQFAHLEREIAAAGLLQDGREAAIYLNDYLGAYFDDVVATGYARCASRLAQQIRAGETIAITEYSRVIKGAMQQLREHDQPVFDSLKLIIVSRHGLLLIDDEPSRMRDELRALGADPIPFGYTEWVEFFLGRRSHPKVHTIDKILFGVEAFSRRGDVVFPQVVKEVEQLRARRLRPGPLANAQIIAAGESYKVCADDAEVLAMAADPHYTVIDHSVFDLIVTDQREFLPRGDATFDLDQVITRVDALCDDVRRSIWPKNRPMPVWNLPLQDAAAITVLGCDIDETVTVEGQIGVGSMRNFSVLADMGIATVLVTGRSAGWACALAYYVPCIAGVVAENGSVFVRREAAGASPIVLDGWDADSLRQLRARMHACFDDIKKSYPHATISSDNFTRLTDLTFDVCTDIEPDVVARIAAAHGLGHTYSSVHHHLKGSALDKEAGLLRAAVEYLGLRPEDVSRCVATIGDGFNDRPLFAPGRYLATFGVRNVLPSLGLLGDHRPDYVTLGVAGEGFGELVARLQESRAQAMRIPAPAATATV